MPVTFTIKLRDEASPAVRSVLANLRSRRNLHLAMGNRVKDLVRRHAISNERRKTATTARLGARRSGFWSQAAEQVQRTTPEADNAGVSIELNHPAWPRAFRDVFLKPLTGLYLTIPLVAEAYNRRAYRVAGLFFLKNKKGNAFLAKRTGQGKGSKLTFYYLLLQSVVQRRDPSLFPTTLEVENSARQGAADYLELLLERLQTGGARA